MQLAIDTSTDSASIALVQDGEVLAESTWRCEQNHSAELLPQLLGQLITLGQMAKQLSHALGGNGHRPEGGVELIQKLVNERR